MLPQDGREGTPTVLGERLEQAGAGIGVHNGWMGLPSGMVTLLFTDMEGSIRLWETDPEAMAEASARHNRIACEQIEMAGGRVIRVRMVLLSGSSR